MDMVKYMAPGNQLIDIPVEELSDNCIQVHNQVDGGDFWIEADRLTLSKPKHPPAYLDPWRQHIVTIVRTFAEVRPTPVEEWEKSFLSDDTPEKDILIWFKTAGKFNDLVKTLQTTKEQRMEIYRLLLASTFSNDRKQILACINPKTLTEQQISAVMEVAER